MSGLVFEDMTIELASRGDCFLTNITHLVLEIKHNGRVIGNANLLSRESMLGVWDVYEIVMVNGVPEELTLSVWMRLDENDRQLVGSIKLNGMELYDKVGTQYETPLLSHENYPDIILRTKILSSEKFRELALGTINRPNEGDKIDKMVSEGLVAFKNCADYGSLASLEQAISTFKAAVGTAQEDDPRLPRIFNYWGTCLRYRFEQLGRLEDVNQSIELFETAAAVTVDNNADKPIFLSNLGRCLNSRFGRLGNVADIHNAISHLRAAVDLFPDGNSNKPICLNGLGTSLLMRYERFGKSADIDDAIGHQRVAVNLIPDGHPDKSLLLANLGALLQRRYQGLGRTADIDDAISHQRAAIDLVSDSDPDKPGYLSSLGSSLRTRFERLGNIADLDDAVVYQQVAVDHMPDGRPDKATCLANLGVSLQERYKRFEKVTDIDNTIVHLRSAVGLTPDDHPNKPLRLSSLGAALLLRFERLGKITDIDDAIGLQKAAVNLTPHDHPTRPACLNHLGKSLCERHVRLRKTADIDDAISHHRAAVNLIPDGHPDKCIFLADLGDSLLKRYELLGNIADIDDALSQRRAAVDLTPDSDAGKPSLLANLGVSLLVRFKRLRNIADIDDAIGLQRTALNLIPENHPQRCLYLKSLGRAFMARADRPDGDEAVKAAIICHAAAAQSSTGSPTIRFEAAETWIFIASLIGPECSLPAYECALGLMPLVAWLGLPIVDRHEHLAKMGAIARDAAAAAISLKQCNKALEWLEQGRSIVWNQILQLRTPVDELRNTNPNLADRLLHVSRLIDRGLEHNKGTASIEKEEQRYRALTDEWESMIKQVRSLPGFEDFLKPPGISQLIDSCQDGPVVVFNIAEKRCDALALVPGFNEVIHIPLPDITSKRVTELRDQFKDMLYSSGMRMRGDRAAKREGDDEIEDCKPILSELWNGLVKPILDSLAFSPHPDVLPRIWWCATGPLAFLPIHAAGIYDDQSVDSHTSDYVISSYTPTLSSLLQSTNPATDARFKLLSVIQPSAPGVSSIPKTEEELKCIKTHLGNREHIILTGQEGTKEQVTKAMEDSNWVHLACHGSQRQDEPTKSGLILEDGHLTLEEIIKLDLPKAELAFLSACQTMTGEESLSDEAVHIAGGMLLAGYRGVVATMWSIQDELAPEVANEFYRYIMGDEGRPDSRKAAEALHYSMERIRKKDGIPLLSWIPFVHLGM